MSSAEKDQADLKAKVEEKITVWEKVETELEGLEAE